MPNYTQPSLPADRPLDDPVPYRAKLLLWIGKPWLLALFIALANAPKPAVVDDAAYLNFARHIAANPTDPYGFSLFWYTVPESAFEILCPPVVPYWLAFGIRLFGESVPLLKLWLYPFLLALVWALRDLLRRFARGSETPFLIAIALSPAILPTVNLMLDVPALALGLSAISLAVRSVERSSWRLALAAGLMAALAMQTKYTALLVPPTILWFGLTRWKISALMRTILTVAIAVAAFACWEWLVAEKYGRSHFLFHLSERRPLGESDNNPVLAFLEEKSLLGPHLTGALGCLGMGIGILTGASLGLPQRTLRALAAMWSIGFAWIALTPANWSCSATPIGITAFWQSFGTVVLFGWALCCIALALKFHKGVRIRCSCDARFLIGWLSIELGGYFVLTPFGAARRAIGTLVVGGTIAARLSSRTTRSHPTRRPEAWSIAFCAATGIAVAAIDVWDAYPEKVCAERAAAATATRPADATVWFAGHWGFQYYCERAGMQHIVPGQSVLRRGDFAVLPIHPDDIGFYRPHIGNIPIRPPEESVELVSRVVWDDLLSAQSVPAFYSGVCPILGRDRPRLRVDVYRMVGDWKVPGR